MAAGKLDQDPAALAEAPQLFLQLLLESPAKALGESTARAFGMVEDEGEPPACIPFENLSVEGNCLLVYYLSDIEGQAVRVGVALKLGWHKIRAALARAAALGRHDVTEQLGTLYQARVEEELDRGRQRRARDAAIRPRKAVRGR